MSKKRALISVSDKTHIVDMAKLLVKLQYEIISTGGTAKTLQEAGVPVTPVQDITGFPEMMDGRVKTLHPKIHGGLLGVRDNPSHASNARENNIQWIDVVIVNLYPFEKTVANPDVTIEDAVENIDIGGPSMIRSAAKNHRFVTVIVDPADYKRTLEEFNIKGETSLQTRQSLAVKAFATTARYDAAIDTFFSQKYLKESKLHLAFDSGETLRYGENGHQTAIFYRQKTVEPTLGFAKKLHGKELSFNNYVDGDAALEAVRELAGKKGAVVIKHTNPCGYATGATLDQALEMAWSGDVVSAFGSVIAVTDTVDIKTARRLAGRFVEILIAPDFDSEALEFLKSKSKDIRLLKLNGVVASPKHSKVYRHIIGGMLEQDRDTLLFEKFETVTTTPFDNSKKDLAEFAYKACKYTKSNAIVLAHEYAPGYFRVVGMGAGQPNRIDSLRKLAAVKAEENFRRFHEEEKSSIPFDDYLKTMMGECVMASDAFFPFADTIDQAAEVGIKYIVQPSGSKRDDEVIAACNSKGIAMIFTGTRHFRH
jgi:phosphoribosylaminoimidazolecarboxamide formyltransferase/IMP cyclohydrolase